MVVWHRRVAERTQHNTRNNRATQTSRSFYHNMTLLPPRHVLSNDHSARQATVKRHKALHHQHKHDIIASNETFVGGRSHHSTSNTATAHMCCSFANKPSLRSQTHAPPVGHNAPYQHQTPRKRVVVSTEPQQG